jgi:asparagine synthetase B (glutamine-hydrolysing)
LISAQDDIVADPSALLLFKLSQFANELNYRVLLAGEGSDELFAGYNSYKYFMWSQQIYESVGKSMPFKSTIKELFGRDSRKYEFVHNSLSEPKFYGTAMI